MNGLATQFSSEFVRMVGWALLHFVWQGALVAGLLRLALATFQRASIRYAISVAALLLMLALPCATFLVMQDRTPTATTAFSEPSSPAPVMSASRGPLRHHVAVPQTEEGRPELMLWLVRLWLAGVVLFSVRSAGGFLLVQRLRSVATVPVSGELLELCVAVQRRMGIERAVRFCRSAALQVPAVAGGIRPMVLLPITALTGLTDSQIEAIIAHELAHIQRLDYFVNVFQVFAETVLFYHPAVWWVNQRIRTERENCCDDTAIAVCGNRLDYVRALTHLEGARIMPRFAMAANGSPLKARVRRLLGMAEENEGIRGGGSILTGMVIAGIVLAASSLVSGAKAQVEKQTPAAASTATEVPKVDINVPASPEVVVPPVRVSVPNVHVNYAVPVVNVPAMNVHSPAVVVDVPAMHLVVPRLPIQAALMRTIDVPAVHVQVPAMNFSVPAIHVHPMLAQAGNSASAQPSESYVDGMKAAGFGDLTVDELVAMKVQGITPEYVRGMHAAGLKLDADELIGMKVQGVTPEYAKELRAAYPGIDADTIIGFKVQGVTPEYAAGLAKLGIKADSDELIGLKVQGVSPEYVRDMQATGLRFDTDELIGMKVQGVTPAYVAGLKSAGLGKLDADEIIGAKVQGITPEFVEKAKSHGFKDLDLDKLIELKNAGVL